MGAPRVVPIVLGYRDDYSRAFLLQSEQRVEIDDEAGSLEGHSDQQEQYRSGQQSTMDYIDALSLVRLLCAYALLNHKIFACTSLL